MNYTVEIRDVALEDLEQIPRNLQQRILKAIEERLQTAPSEYGMKLRQSLASLWKVRVGDYRIVYELIGSKVVIWAICHRKEVYEEVQRRWRKRT